MGTSRRILPWAPIAISVEKSPLEAFPGRAVLTSVTAPYNDVCADLEPLHSGFSAAALPIPVILHGNQSILMIQS